MNKADLVASVSDKSGLTKKDTEAVIQATLEVITQALQSEDKVQLVGFGSFETKHRAERMGRNPKTLEDVLIPASTVPAFKAGKALRDAVAGK
jgi:DNA-binding protein HU-beta